MPVADTIPGTGRGVRDGDGKERVDDRGIAKKAPEQAGLFYQLVRL
jgi:hypothetical protein